MSKETQIYLAIWRKAWQKAISDQDDGEPLTIRASSKASALTMRTGLYRTVRPYRAGEKFDAEIQSAIEALTVSAPYETDQGFAIDIRPRAAIAELEAQLVGLGIGEGDIDDGIPVSEELLRLVDPGAGKRSTPFYERD